MVQYVMRHLPYKCPDNDTLGFRLVSSQAAMGAVWSVVTNLITNITHLGSYKSLFKFPGFACFKQGWGQVSYESYADYERVIRDKVDAANAAQLKIPPDGEDCLPNCDLTVWLRDFKQEVKLPMSGSTTGTIPKWLKGSLIRNGPGSQTVGNYSFNHLFDASAALHRFHIEDGRATYQIRLLKTETLKRNHAAQRIVISEFGTKRVPDPCKTIFQRFASYFTLEEESDNCLVSVYPFGDEVYTLTEMPVMHRIDPETLETLGSVNVSKHVNIVHHTSHPHVEKDGLVCNIGLSVGVTGPVYTIVQFPNTQQSVKAKENDVFSNAKLVAHAQCRWPFHPGYMHTFGITDNYYVLVEQPMSVSVPSRLASNFNNKPLSRILKWYENYPTLIHVLSKETGNSIATFLAEPFFYLHIINQYEDGNNVVIDICAYKDPSMIDCMLLESLKTAKQNPNYSKMFRGRPVRYVLPLSRSNQQKKNLITLKNTNAKAYQTEDGKVFVIPEILCDMGCETPRINYPKFLGRKYRYFYAISADVDLESPGTLIKVDTDTKTKKTWTEVGTFPSEPIFVPAPNQKEEDDGVILSTLLWGKEDTKVAIVVLDARDLTELGRTTFQAPGPVPKCLHGWYFPQ